MESDGGKVATELELETKNEEKPSSNTSTNEKHSTQTRPDKQSLSQDTIALQLWLELRNDSNEEKALELVKKIDKDHINAWAASRICDVDVHNNNSSGYPSGYGDWCTPLCCAVTNKRNKVVDALLAAGANFEAPNSDNRSILARAVLVNNTHAIDALLKAGAKADGDPKQAPIVIAALTGRLESIKLLLARGADPSPALGWCRLPEAAKLLLAHEKCDINYKNPGSGGMTALHRAAFRDDVTMMEVLLNHKPAPNIELEDEDGRTPFMRCGFSFYRPSEDLASLKLLVKHGANIYAKSKSGSYKSALVTAIQAENFNVVKYLVDDLGMDPTHSFHNQSDGDTLLHSSVSRGNVEISRWLIEKGCSPMVRNQLGLTPVLVAYVMAYPSKEDPSKADHIKKMKELSNQMFLCSEIHPFEPYATGATTPFIVKLADVAPLACQAVCNKFQKHKGAWSGFSYEKWNFALCTKRHYDYMTSYKARNDMIRVLESQNRVLLKQPAIQELIEQLWINFTRPRMYFQLAVYLLLLIFTTWWVNLPNDGPTGLDTIRFTSHMAAISFIVAIFSVLQLIFEARDFFFGGLSVRRIFGYRVRVPTYFTEFWNWFDIIEYLVMIGLSLTSFSRAIMSPLPASLATIDQAETILLSLSVLYLWLKALEYLAAFRPSAGTVRTMFLIFVTVVKFLVVVAVFVIGFAHAFFIQMQQYPSYEAYPFTNSPAVQLGVADNYATLPKSLATTFLAFLSQSQFAAISASGDVLAHIYFFAYSIFVTVVLMNLLIALMNSIYADVQADVLAEFLARRVMFVSAALKPNTLTDNQWRSLCVRVIFPKDEGLTGLLAPPPLGSGFSYRTHPWLMSAFYSKRQIKHDQLERNPQISAVSELLLLQHRDILDRLQTVQNEVRTLDMKINKKSD